MLKILLLITLLVASHVSASERKSTVILKLATTEWCPYACESSKLGQGIVYDYLSMILNPTGTEIELTFLPWADAIRAVEAGKYHGLLTAIQSEAPTLAFTRVPTMHYKMCLFTEQGDNWQYTGRDSLKSRQLGVIESYGYGEPIDSYIKDPKNSNQVTVFKGDNSVERLSRLLTNGKIDAFIEDGYVVKWQSRGEDTSHFQQAGCLRPVPFYMAFNNDFAKRSRIVPVINAALSKPKYKNYLNQYMLPHYFSSKSSNWEK